MPRNKIPDNRNHTPSTDTLSTEILRISNIQAFSENLKSLAKANGDWDLTPAQIAGIGKANHKIYKIKFTGKPVRFTPAEEVSGTTNVMVNGKTIGILDQDNTARLKELIASSEIHSVSCMIQGGLYKIVDQDQNVHIQQKGISAAVKILHKPEAASVAAAPVAKKRSQAIPSEKTAAKKATKKASPPAEKKKKPFYKRAWVWILAVILALGSCGNDTGTGANIETTVPSTSIVQTETTLPATTAAETTQVPTTEPTTIPTTEPTTIPTTAPTTIPTTEPATVPSPAETPVPIATAAPAPVYTDAPYQEPAAESDRSSVAETKAAAYDAPVVEAPVVEEKSAMVWIPRTGKRYHISANCSNMKGPSHVTKQTAISMGFTPCKKCYG